MNFGGVMAKIKFRKSGSKTNKLYIPTLTKAATLVVEKLLPESDDLTLTIAFKKLPAKTNARLDVVDGDTNNLTIYLNKDSGFIVLALYLCHELVHAKQVYTGQLSFGTNNDMFIWKNGSESAELSVASSVERESDFELYKDQPWEAEAYSKQQELLDLCKKELCDEVLDLGDGLTIPLF